MPLAKRDHMIQQVASAALNPSLGDSILPGALERGLNRTHGHRSNCDWNLMPILRVAVEEQERSRGLIRKRLAQLLNDPGTCRMPRDIAMQDLSAIMTQDEEAIEHAERQGRNCEEVHGCDHFTMIPQECVPSPSRDRVAHAASTGQPSAQTPGTRTSTALREFVVRPMWGSLQPCERSGRKLPLRSSSFRLPGALWRSPASRERIQLGAIARPSRGSRG